MPQTTPGSLRSWRAAYVLLACLGAAAATRLVLDSRNTLFNNGGWISGKIGLYRPPVNNVAFMTSRTALSRNRLNPSAWQGYQKLLYKDSLELRSLDVDFSLEDGAYLSFLYNAGPRGFSGVRLSRDSKVASIRFTAREDGKFLASKPLPWLPLGSGRHRLSLLFGRGNVSLRVDGLSVESWREPLLKSQSFGVWGGPESRFASAYVYRFDAETASGRLLGEDFRNDRHAWLFFLGFAAFLASPMALFRAKSRLSRLTMALAPACLGLCAYLVVDFFCLSARYPSPPKTALYNLEGRWLADPRTQLAAPLGARLSRARPAPPEGNVLRILFIGTSQTWGAGAPRPGDSWVERIERRLNRLFKGHPAIEGLNGGIAGSDSTELIGLYEKKWIKFAPRLVVADLSNNDQDTSRLIANLRRLAALDKKAEIATALVLEANADGKGSRRQERSRAAMRALAKKEDIPVYDLNRFLAGRRDTGFIWWDNVHLTLYGQKLAAEFLAPRIAGLIRRLSRSPRGSS